MFELDLRTKLDSIFTSSDGQAALDGKERTTDGGSKDGGSQDGGSVCCPVITAKMARISVGIGRHDGRQRCPVGNAVGRQALGIRRHHSMDDSRGLVTVSLDSR